MRRALLGFVSASALTVAVTTTASAADLAPVFKAPPAEPVYDWSGFYVGGHAGFGAANGYSQLVIDTFNEELRANGPRGALWGVQAGYNHQVGRMVFGIEGDWSWLDAQSTNTYTAVAVPIANSTSLEVKSLASVRGRFGITANQLLLYATMGGAWMRGRYAASDALVIQLLGVGPIDRDLNSFGIAFGGGAEWALGNGFSLRAEYLRYSFGASAGPIDTTSITVNRVASAKVDSIDVARLGLNYSFFKPAPARTATGTLPYWTGFYVGGHAGYAASSASTDLIHDFQTEDLKAEGPRGGIFGAQVGYNHQVGRVVYGIEGDWSSANQSRSNSRTLPIPGTPLTSSVDHTLKMLASVRGRVGITADQLLLYATAGWGFARTEYRAFDALAALPTASASGNLSASGLVYGGGAEWALGQGWSVRAEYLHYAFASSDGPIPTGTDGRVTSHINSVDVVRASLNYNLQQQPATPAPTAVANWTGTFVGGHAGYGMAAATAQMTRDVVVEELRAESPRNGVFGVQLGYNQQIDRVVWGVEGDWSWFNASQDNSFLPAIAVPFPASVDQKIQWLASARARAGIAVDQLLLYGTVGWGWAKAEFSATDSSFPSASLRDSMIADGLVYGAGAEWNLGNGLSARAEYLHYAFGQNLGPYRFSPTSDARTASYRVDAADVVRAGLNYRFTGPVWPTGQMPR